ncbi:hypothetical protein [Prochlorococcus marinus]|nr:hypothetical protein [Prochlorococcus marinus]
MPVAVRKEIHYRKYVWEYPVIGTRGYEDFEKVCSHKGGYDFKE